MMRSRVAKPVLATVLVLCLIGATVVVSRSNALQHRIHLTAYFANSNGIYAGDEVRVLGVPVGKIDRIEPQPQRAKITFWVDDQYKIPANVKVGCGASRAVRTAQAEGPLRVASRYGPPGTTRQVLSTRFDSARGRWHS